MWKVPDSRLASFSAILNNLIIPTQLYLSGIKAALHQLIILSS